MARPIIKLPGMVLYPALMLAMLCSSGGISYISWHTLQRLIFKHECVQNGILRSEQAAAIRESMITEHAAQEIIFTTEDNVQLAGLFVPRPHPKAHLIVGHGYLRDKEGLASLLTLFPEYSFFLFDFRAHGMSGGLVTTIGDHESRDVRAAVQCMRELVAAQQNQFQTKPYVVLGFSMGAAAALKAHVEHPTLCDAIIADSSYADLYDEITHAFTLKTGLPRIPFLEVTRLMSKYLCGIDLGCVRPVDYMREINVPVLLVHSCTDTITKPEDALALFHAAYNAGRRVKLWITPPCYHAQMFLALPADYKLKIEKFITKYLHYA